MINNKYECWAKAAFGLEGIIAKELRYQGLDAKAELGGVRFKADIKEILYANINLRCSDRVLIIANEAKVISFDELFDLTLNTKFFDLLPKNANIIVNVRCVKSVLMSQTDSQAIVKRAIIKKMQNKYNVNILPENGARYKIEVSIHNDIAKIMVDTSGESLNKRGYRTWNAEAPIRETLAAAIINLSPWRMRQKLYDPCCGSGTFLIEAAMMALKKPAGIARTFDMEAWGMLSKGEADEIREKSNKAFDKERTIEIEGSDISSEVLILAKKHIVQAGLSNRIKVSNIDLNNVNLDEEEGYFIVNPPYGERLSSKKAVQYLYKDLGKLLARHPGWGMAVISNDNNFEKFFGKRADKKRRVYNGAMECNVFIYNPIKY